MDFDALFSDALEVAGAEGLVNCFCCGQPRNTNELNFCLKCEARCCGMDGCEAKCVCQMIAYWSGPQN